MILPYVNLYSDWYNNMRTYKVVDISILEPIKKLIYDMRTYKIIDIDMISNRVIDITIWEPIK